MPASNSISASGVETHVNRYAEKHNIKYRYKDLVDWVQHGVLGQPVSLEWMRRQFKPVTKPTFYKWVKEIKG